MWICIDQYVVQFSEITKKWSSDSISLKDLLIVNCKEVVLVRTQNILQFLKNRSKTFETELQQISYYKFDRNSLFFVFFMYSSCSSSSKVCGGSSSKLLGAWIRKALLICAFLKFLEAFSLILANFKI